MPSTTELALEGMSGPEPLRLMTHQGEAVVLSGRRVLFQGYCKVDLAVGGVSCLTRARRSGVPEEGDSGPG